jgi:molybdate-binding protein
MAVNDPVSGFSEFCKEATAFRVFDRSKGFTIAEEEVIKVKSFQNLLTFRLVHQLINQITPQ